MTETSGFDVVSCLLLYFSAALILPVGDVPMYRFSRKIFLGFFFLYDVVWNKESLWERNDFLVAERLWRWSVCAN